MGTPHKDSKRWKENIIEKEQLEYSHRTSKIGEEDESFCYNQGDIL